MKIISIPDTIDEEDMLSIDSAITILSQGKGIVFTLDGNLAHLFVGTNESDIEQLGKLKVALRAFLAHTEKFRLDLISEGIITEKD